MTLFFAIGGLGAGIVSGLLGIGGAVILIPYLLFFVPIFYLTGITPFQATEISMFQVLIASLAGYLSHRPATLLPVRTLLLWGGSALVGSGVGGFLSHRISGRLLLEIYLLEILTALFLLFRKPLPIEKTPHDLERIRKKWGPVTMSLIGLVSGILGIGGGFLYYPVMTGIMGYSSTMAVGSSLGVMIPMALAGVIGKTAAAGSIPLATWPVVGGALAGSIIGARLHFLLTPRIIRWGQTLLLLATFFRILISLIPSAP
ncbi:MAG: sulfite exporter TauE/SafE family protein [Leptospirales bacterium]